MPDPHLVGSGIFFTSLIIDILLDSGAQPKAEGENSLSHQVAYFKRLLMDPKWIIMPHNLETPNGLPIYLLFP